MKKRILGKTNLEIAPLIFGGNVFGWTVNESDSFRLLDQFFENGFNCIDTSNSYSNWVPGNKGGESETIVGNWLKKSKKRDELIIITKVGWEINESEKGLSKKYIIKAVEGSLKRLQTEYIDLYFSHKDDPNTPVEETLEAYDQLIKQGKVRYIGASNFYKDRLEESIKVSKKKKLYEYKVIQPKYNLYDRQFEKGKASVAKEYGLGVITYSSLASGFLTGKYESEKDFTKSPRGAGMKKYLDEKGFSILKAIKYLSRKYSCTPATISLAWLLQNPLVTAPIASATNKEQLDELMMATNKVLSPSDMRMLDELDS
ncbi:MAG: aldo/keto reductase [Ginsengibacter sp.]|jgi:aryl-alcohol dehydrogenase-like predicted oxidoreductase